MFAAFNATLPLKIYPYWPSLTFCSLSSLNFEHSSLSYDFIYFLPLTYHFFTVSCLSPLFFYINLIYFCGIFYESDTGVSNLYLYKAGYRLGFLFIALSRSGALVLLAALCCSCTLGASCIIWAQ